MRGRSFGMVLDAAERRFGRRTALSDQSRDWTYAEAIGTLRASGRALRKLGLGPGDRVGLLIGDSPELAFALYGALWAGITVVPLNARLAADDHAYMLEDSGARAFVVDADHLDHGAEILSRLEIEIVLGTSSQAADSLGCRDLGALAAAEETGPQLFPDVDPSAEALILYTGGTTGRPKGAVHSDETMLTALLGCTLEYDVRPDEVFAMMTPLTHSGAAMFLPVWMRGGTNLLLGGFDPEALVQAIETRGVTSTLMVPTMISALLSSGFLPDPGRSRLRTVVYGASPIARPLLEEAMAAFGPIFIQGYGQTEAFSQIATLGKDEHSLAIRERPELLAAAGRPVAIADVVVDGEEAEPAAAGTVGEVLVRGPHVILEYLNKPDQTAEALAGGWLRTGDVGAFDEDGYVYLLDRKNDVIITGGFNVYSKEVEAALDDHPAVAQSCVIGVPDEKWGEAVTAVVVLEAEAEAEALIDFVKARKGSVHAPKSVETVDALPQTSLGKIDKGALRARFWTDRDRAVN